MKITSKHHDIFIKRVKQGMTHSSIAKEYGVSRQYICSVVQRLHKIDYLRKLETPSPQKMSDLILSARVMTFLKKNGYYDKPISYFLLLINVKQLLSCTNISVKSLLELLNTLEQTCYKDSVGDFRDIIEELRREIRHV
tara:strand:- start:1071 stop:1487 length:417 start_codon:yes stop_codon:yes gene_type:complete